VSLLALPGSDARRYTRYHRDHRDHRVRTGPRNEDGVTRRTRPRCARRSPLDRGGGRRQLSTLIRRQLGCDVVTGARPENFAAGDQLFKRPVAGDGKKSPSCRNKCAESDRLTTSVYSRVTRSTRAVVPSDIP
jgi:hypothetical protein